MITEKEVERYGMRPYRARAVLADLIIIQDYLFGEPTRAQEVPQMPMPMQSYSAPPMEQVEIYVETNGDSEFLKVVNGRKAEEGVWKPLWKRTRGGGQDTTPKDVHDFHRQGTRPITIQGSRGEIPLLFCCPFIFITFLEFFVK